MLEKYPFESRLSLCTIKALYINIMVADFYMIQN